MVCVNCSEKEALTIIWAIKEASCKAYRAKGILVKDIMLRKAKLNGDYVICELCYPDRACVKSVAFQSSGYAYAVSRLIA